VNVQPSIGAGTLVSSKPLALLFCVLTPICLALAFPPLSLWPVALVTPLGWALLASSDRLPHYTWWVLYGSALAVWLWLHRWMIDVTVAGYPVLCGYLALYAVAGVWIMRRTRHGFIGRHLPRAIRLPAVLITLEWLQGTVIFHGYPWFAFAQPLVDFPLLAQLADIGGVPLVTLVVGATVGVLVDLICLLRGTPDPTLRRHVRVGGAAVVIAWVAALAYGAHRLSEWDSIQRTASPGSQLRVAVVQTNVPTSNKMRWSRQQQEEDAASFAKLTFDLVEASAAGGGIDLAVWPETMLPGFGLESATLQKLVDGQWWPGDRFATLARSVSERIHAPLVVGSPTYIGLRENGDRWAWSEHFNSAYLVDGEPPYQRYDKIHLTPFGEIMPYISHWKWLEEKLLAIGATGMQFDLDTAPVPRRLTVQRRSDAEGNASVDVIPLATPICFEDTMSEVVRRTTHDEAGQKQAKLLVNLSNDGWFGACDSGRETHELLARWRCIENRLPMVRAANTGFSRAFNSSGVPIEGAEVAPRTAGGFIASLPTDHRQSIFGRRGDVLSPAMAVLLAIMVVPVRKGVKTVSVVAMFACALLLVGCSEESQPRAVFSGTGWSSRGVDGQTGAPPINPDSGRGSRMASESAASPQVPSVELTSQPLDSAISGTTDSMPLQISTAPLMKVAEPTAAQRPPSAPAAAEVPAPAPPPAPAAVEVPAPTPPPALAAAEVPAPAPPPAPAAVEVPVPAPPPAPAASEVSAPAPPPAPSVAEVPAPTSLPASAATTPTSPAAPIVKFTFVGVDAREQMALDVIARAASSEAAILRSHALEALQTRPDALAEVACKLLGDPSPGVRFAAAVTIGRKRLDRCTTLLQPLLLDANPSVQAAALFALARLGQRMDLNPLLRLAMSEDPETRSNAFFVLGELRNPSAIPLIEACIGRPLRTVDEVRTRIVELQAAEAMCKMGDYRQYDPIRAALFAPSEQAELIALACQMVGEVNDRGARGSLIGIWNGRGSMERPMEIRLLTGTALVRIGEPNAEPIYLLCLKAIKDPSASIRAQAASTLGWIGGERAADAVAPLLQEADSLVAISASAAYLRATAKPTEALPPIGATDSAARAR